MSWLVVKVERATKRFVEVTQAGQGAEEIGGEGFASGFTAIATTPDARHKGEIEAECRQQALEAVCEYLAEDWGAKLAGRFRYCEIPSRYRVTSDTRDTCVASYTERRCVVPTKMGSCSPQSRS